MSAPSGLLLSRCESCHARFLPRPGPCPRCASASVRPVSIPAVGVVVASVELTAPATPWPAPHRIVLVAMEESVQVLALWTGELPRPGQHVRVTRDGDRYSAAPE